MDIEQAKLELNTLTAEHGDLIRRRSELYLKVQDMSSMDAHNTEMIMREMAPISTRLGSVISRIRSLKRQLNMDEFMEAKKKFEHGS